MAAAKKPSKRGVVEVKGLKDVQEMAERAALEEVIEEDAMEALEVPRAEGEVLQEGVHAPIPEEEEAPSKRDVVSVSIDRFVPEDRPEENARIRLREDHSCTIAKERYVFKKGGVYYVPKNVKRILGDAGLLAPIN